MTESKHTPGPWERLDNHIIGGGGMGHTTAVVPSFGYKDSVAVANAHLIAAAPDLLEVCEMATWGHSGFDDAHGHAINKERLEILQERARTAIARARGEA